MGTNPMLWAFSFIWGALLGLFYFGGLWMTLKVMTRANKPKSWLGMSFIIRISVIMAGFWVIMKVDAVSLIFTFSAFLITRVILTRALGRER